MAIGMGSRGDEVKDYQRKMNAAGANPPLVVDGIWGPKTQAAHDWYSSLPDSETETSSEVTLDTGTPESYAEDSRFFGVGGHPEIWYNESTGESYLVFDIPGTDPPVPMYWRIESDEHLEAYFGEGNPVMYDRVVTTDVMTSIGAVYNGLNTEIVVTDGDPIAAITERIEKDMAVRPYLTDPQVAAIIAASAIEGNPPTAADFDGTDWWQTHNDRERAWLLLEASDPETAKIALEAGRLKVRQMLRDAGVYDAPDDLVNLMADQYTMGAWDEAKLTSNVNGVADPYYDGAPVDETVSDWMEEYATEGGTLDTNTEEEKWVEETVRKWLGPTYGVLSESQISDIAGRIRNDPNYRDVWLSELQQQRMTLFPEYTDPLSSYDEIAGSWRSVWLNTLGEQADEESTLFQEIVQNNDLGTARQKLRGYGLETGNEKVTNEAMSSLGSALNFGVRRVV